MIWFPLKQQFSLVSRTILRAPRHRCRLAGGRGKGSLVLCKTVGFLRGSQVRHNPEITLLARHSQDPFFDASAWTRETGRELGPQTTLGASRDSFIYQRYGLAPVIYPECWFLVLQSGKELPPPRNFTVITCTQQTCGGWFRWSQCPGPWLLLMTRSAIRPKTSVVSTERQRDRCSPLS